MCRLSNTRLGHERNILKCNQVNYTNAWVMPEKLITLQDFLCKSMKQISLLLYRLAGWNDDNSSIR